MTVLKTCVLKQCFFLQITHLSMRKSNGLEMVRQFCVEDTITIGQETRVQLFTSVENGVARKKEEKIPSHMDIS